MKRTVVRFIVGIILGTVGLMLLQKGSDLNDIRVFSGYQSILQGYTDRVQALCCILLYLSEVCSIFAGLFLVGYGIYIAAIKE